MKIILPVQTFFPRSGGGTEVYTLALARNLEKVGHRVLVVTCESNLSGESSKLSTKEDVWQGIHVLRLSFNVLHSPNPISFDYYNPHIENYLQELYAKEEADLIHICHPGNLSTAVITAAKKNNLPVIMTATDFWSICPTSQLLRHDRTLCPGPVDPAHCLVCFINQRESAKPYRKWANRIPVSLLRLGVEMTRSRWAKINRHARMVSALVDRPDLIRQILDLTDWIVSPSRFLRDRLVENGIPFRKIIVSAHGIDTGWLSSFQWDKPGADHLRFGYIGSTGWHKGVHLAVQAFNLLSHPDGATLTLYGDHEQETAYSSQLTTMIKRNPRVSFGGKFPHSQIARVLASIDVLVMPSMWYENTPTVLYEAFASKTPVIASDFGGMLELIQDFSGGWTFPRGDVEALSSKMQTMIKNPSQVKQARNRILPVRTIDEHVAKVLDLYRKLT